MHENKTGLRPNFSWIFAGMVLLFMSRQVIMENAVGPDARPGLPGVKNAKLSKGR